MSWVEMLFQSTVNFSQASGATYQSGYMHKTLLFQINQTLRNINPVEKVPLSPYGRIVHESKWGGWCTDGIQLWFQFHFTLKVKSRWQRDGNLQFTPALPE